MENVQIVYSKLIPPIPSDTYMRRSPFFKQMNKSKKYRLTILQSGPGFGKSLGLAQYFRDTRLTYSWYTVTEEDDDISPFIAYLEKSIQRTIPTFGRSLRHITTPSTFLKEDELRQWIALFINELCELDDPLTIIIDDFHLVDHVFQINMVMEKLVELLPPHVHIIISTRSRPKWSNLLKLKLNEQLFEIRKDSLLFSKEEIIIYLEDYFNIEIGEEKADEIFEVTEGWAIAINLMALQLSDSEKSLSKSIKPVFRNLFDYLSEEVYQRRSAGEQAWLLKFAIFPTFSVELISEFYGKRAVTVLQKLAVEHGFIQSLQEDETYRYHSLFQRFLTNKWLQTDPEIFTELHKRASEYFEDKANYIQATYHATQTKDNEFIGRVLDQTASSLIRSGQFDWYLEIFNQLDGTVKMNHYSLYYYEGEVHRYRAFYELARKAYLRCLSNAEQLNDAYFLSRSYAGLAHIFLDTIQPTLAESYLKKAIDWSQVTNRMQDKEKAMLKRQFAENLVNLGRAKDATIWVKGENLSTSILREGNLDARIYLRMGKLEAAKATLQEQAFRTNLPDSHRETEVLLSFIYSLTGEKEQALQAATKGIEIGKEVNSGFIEAVGHTRVGHAEMLLTPIDLYHAEKSYNKAINMMERLNVSRGKAEPAMGLSLINARKGRFQEAMNYGNLALRETDKVNDHWMSGLIRIGLAMVYFYQGNVEHAERHILHAEKLFKTSGDLYGEMVSLFWLMNIYDKNNDNLRLIDVSQRFLSILIQEGYMFFMKKDTLFGPIDREMIHPLMNKVYKFLSNREEIQVIATQLNLKNDHPGYQIYTTVFAEIKVILGTNLVEQQWHREKAKELFVYLLLHRDRFVPKEEMMQALWGNMDVKSADRNFKVTLNALLKVLEPNREARQQSFFIIRKNALYRINPLAKVICDMDLFDDYAEQGLQEQQIHKSIISLLKADTQYKGTPFEEIRDVDWVAQKREELESKYIRVMERLAQHYVKLENHEKAIYWAEKILRLDKTWEEAYRLLMIAYYQLQNRPQSIKWYDKCVDVLQEELNIRPMEWTNKLYEMIVNHYN